MDRLKISNQNAIFLIWILVGFAVTVWALKIVAPIQSRLLYSDQATHVMIASSIWNDGDLKYSLTDLQRFREDYPKETGPRGLFLKQGGEDWFFAKPYIYGLTAAPFYAAFGLDGFIILNVLCLIAIGLAAGYALMNAFGCKWAIAVSVAFTLPSAFLPWIFVSHPDLFIAALLGVGGYLLINQNSTKLMFLTGVFLLGAALHEKLPFLIILPFIIVARRGLPWGYRFMVGFSILACWLMFSSVNLMIDGSLLSYQGMRLYAHGNPFPLEPGWTPPTKGVTGHVFDPIGVIVALFGNLSLLPEKLIDFVVGRQTGILPYFPVAAVLILLIPLVGAANSALLISGLFLYLIVQWLVFPTNGYGGAGSYGSRYLAQALPLVPLAFLGLKIPEDVQKWGKNTRLAKFLLVIAAGVGVVLQHQLLYRGNESVMRYWLSNIAPPFNYFRLERWLLPTTFIGASKKYVEEADGGSVKLYKLNEMGGDLWERSINNNNESKYVIYKRDLKKQLPALAIEVSTLSDVKIYSEGRILWEGTVSAGQPQRIELNGALPFRSAYDIFLKSQVAIAELSVLAEIPAEGMRNGTAASASFHFDSDRSEFIAYGKRLTVGELVAAGVDLRKGWSHVEQWGVWTDGEIANMSLRVGKGGALYNLVLGVHAYVPDKLRPLKVDIRCAEGQTLEETIEQNTYKDIDVKCSKLPDHEYLNIEMVMKDPTSPYAEGRGLDRRRLGIGLNSFKLDRAD